MKNVRQMSIWVASFLLTIGMEAHAQQKTEEEPETDNKQVHKEMKVTVKEKDGEPEYTVETTTTENGERKVVKKTYKSREEMEADNTIDIMRYSDEKGNISMSIGEKGSGLVVISTDEGETFDIRIDEITEDMEWIEESEEDGKTVIQLKGGKMVYISEDEDSAGHSYSFHSSDGDSNKIVKKYEVRMKSEGEDDEHQITEHKNVFVFRDDEGNVSMHQSDWEDDIEVWVDEDGNRTREKTIHVKSRSKEFSTASIEDINTGDGQFSAFQLSGMPELELKSLNYYPNPNAGEFTLAFTSTKKPVIVRILDLKGNLMMEENIREFDGNFNQVLNVKDFKKGTYLLQIFQQNKVLNKKLTLE